MTPDDKLFISTTCNSNTSYYLPIICSLLILSPYLFKFVSFISPLLFTIFLLIICVIATLLNHPKPGFVQTIADKLRPKVTEEEEDGQEFQDFEESEIFKTVFDDPMLVMENSERKLERLFEELDRFEDSTAMLPEVECRHIIPVSQYKPESKETAFRTAVPENQMLKPEVECSQILPLSQDKTESKETASGTAKLEYQMLKSPMEKPVSRQNIPTVNPESVKSDVEACSSEAAKSKTSRIFRSLESIKSDLEKASAMATTTTAANSAESHKTNENEKENLVTVKSIISRLESSRTFGGYRLTKLDLEEASSTAISTSGDDENTVKSSSNSCSPSFGSYDSPKSDPEETEDTKTVESSAKSTSNSMRVELDSSTTSFGSYGSMRKEKEWKRTLACKLFEERRSLEGGGEGMDSLWEAYEDDNTNKKASNNQNKKTIVKNNKKAKSEFKYFDDGVSEDGDEDDEFTGNAQLCCLKALKMSTGKMNLGMGKPNLVKFSKALKGFGWLHHKHAKKC